MLIDRDEPQFSEERGQEIEKQSQDKFASRPRSIAFLLKKPLQKRQLPH